MDRPSTGRMGKRGIVGQTWNEASLVVTVMARDEDHAAKIAADLFRQHIATVGWKNP